jgi:primosomal protein N' (replication factor Y) (superfamily II helicase)
MPVARVALPVAAPTTFDYWIPQGIAIDRGAIVRVQLGPRRLAGVVVEIASDSDVDRAKLAPVIDVITEERIPGDVLELCAFVSAYYQDATGLAHALAMPSLAAKTASRALRGACELTEAGKRALASLSARATTACALRERLLQDGALNAETLTAHERTLLREWRRLGYVAPVRERSLRSSLSLNPAQSSAVSAITASLGGYAAFMLNGVTGSGKTEVYLAAADAVLAAGGQVLMLVPEINLTPQLVDRVRAARPGLRVALMHSALASGERREAWHAAAAGQAQLVLGTRLAVFAPMPLLGLVVVDEEHDASYKQQDNVRYHARDVAIWRAHRRGVPVVLGSATPSLETWLAAREGRYTRLDLAHRADTRAQLPVVRFAPHRAAAAQDGIGDALRDAIAVRLARGEQSLVFVNRRGFAPSLVCAACKWESECPRCSARLTVHRSPPSLRCHHCAHEEALPRACPSCGNVDLVPLGLGTQRLERALASAFPGARIARVDRDSTRGRHAFASVRDQVEANAIDILVGTQMLAKGHDFPRLTLVGILGGDNALYSADFRATERLAALLVQVAGRAGRAGAPGEVIVQTDFPEHPVYTALLSHDYAQFADTLLIEREAAALPPSTHAALLSAEAHRRDDVDDFMRSAHEIGIELRTLHADVDLFSPVPALLARRAGYERSQLVVQSARRSSLQRFLPAWRERIDALPGRRTRWSIDVDPAGFG